MGVFPWKIVDVRTEVHGSFYRSSESVHGSRCRLLLRIEPVKNSVEVMEAQALASAEIVESLVPWSRKLQWNSILFLTNHDKPTDDKAKHTYLV